MAANAIVDVANTFLAVLGDYPVLLMLMASVAGVLLVIAGQVAGRAGGIVIAIEQKIATVVECCRFPVRWLVACRTCRLAAMQVILRSRVTRLATAARIRFEQGMVEFHRTGLRQFRPRVIAVAGHAVGLGERLMKCRVPLRLGNCHSLGSAQANISHDMATGAAIG